MPYMIFLMALIFAQGSAHASSSINYSYLSPDAIVDVSADRYIRLKTKRNTLIHITLGDEGKLESVEGTNFSRGDIFIPGRGILDLSTIENKMISQGHRIYGKWRLIKYQEFGWVYQVNVVSNLDQSLFYIINAYSGELIGTMAKLAPLRIEGQVAVD